MNTARPASAKSFSVQRRFIKIGDRRVHYLRVGEGPPALLIHASPANAREMLPAIRHLQASFTCFAFDTPGFGLSDPLPLPELSVADLADALAEALRVACLPPCPVYGRHTGAAIAIELAIRHPQLVTGVVLDGLSVFTVEEVSSMLRGYFPDIPTDELGGHFTRAWTRFRDHSLWFPWFERNPKHLNPYDLVPAAQIQNWVMMFFDSANTYVPVYRAAMSHGQRALAAVGELESPAVYMALETDMLYPHLGRLPALNVVSEQKILPVGKSIDAKHQAVLESFRRFGSDGVAPDEVHELVSSSTVERQFIDGAHGQIHLRYAGNRDALPLLLLHDAPGSTQFLEPLIAALSARYFVCAPDLPGCGESDPLPGDQPSIADYAETMVRLCAHLGFPQAIVYGIGFGSSLAIAMATLAPESLAGLVLRGVLLPDAVERQLLQDNYTPPISIESDGSHWYRTWLMLRDSLVYWPWFDRRMAALRRVRADFGADRLHAWTFDLMKQHASYQHLIQAALDHDGAAALATLKLRMLFCKDPATPLSVYDARLEALFPDVPRYAAIDDAGHLANIAGRFMALNRTT